MQFTDLTEALSHNFDYLGAGFPLSLKLLRLISLLCHQGNYIWIPTRLRGGGMTLLNGLCAMYSYCVA